LHYGSGSGDSPQLFYESTTVGFHLSKV
jgi:hypothetical protein